MSYTLVRSYRPSADLVFGLASRDRKKFDRALELHGSLNTSWATVEQKLREIDEMEEELRVLLGEPGVQNDDDAHPGDTDGRTESSRPALRRLVDEARDRATDAPRPVEEPAAPDGFKLSENHRQILLAVSPEEDTDLATLAQALYGGDEPGQRDAARQIAKRLVHKKLIVSLGGSRYRLTAAGVRQQALLRKEQS